MDSEKDFMFEKTASVIRNPTKLRPVRRSLVLSIAIAFGVGIVQVLVGVLGIITYFNVGPLAKASIPLAQLQGYIVNTVNVAALLSAAATGTSFAGRHVYSGVSRAWLWRRVSRGEGPTIRAWQAMSSKGSLRAVGKARVAAGFMLAAMVGATGVMSTVFSGLLLPAIKTNFVTGSITGVPGYKGNSFQGDLVNCLGSTLGNLCAPAYHYGSITDAISNSLDSATFDINGVSVWPGASFSASIVGYLDGFAGMSIPLYGDIPTYRTVGLQVSTVCAMNGQVGTTANKYSYPSKCFSENLYFGNSSDKAGTYSAASGCSSSSGNAYILEYAAAGGQFAKPISISCTVQANEGIITSSTSDSSVSFSDFNSGSALSGDEIAMFATAFPAVVLQDGAVVGRPGLVSLSFSGISESGSPDLTAAAEIMSSAMAAAATAGYLVLVPPSTGALFKYPTLHNGAYLYQYNVYGWSSHVGKLAWGIISTVFGLSWFVAAIYMFSGGTTYDPNDWLQTMNTSAGSRFVQFPGTSTGSGLDSVDVEKVKVWYGEIGHNGVAPQVGFSMAATVPIHRERRYN